MILPYKYTRHSQEMGQGQNKERADEQKLQFEKERCDDYDEFKQFFIDGWVNGDLFFLLGEAAEKGRDEFLKAYDKHVRGYSSPGGVSHSVGMQALSNAGEALQGALEQYATRRLRQRLQRMLEAIRLQKSGEANACLAQVHFADTEASFKTYTKN